MLLYTMGKEGYQPIFPPSKLSFSRLCLREFVRNISPALGYVLTFSITDEEDSFCMNFSLISLTEPRRTYFVVDDSRNSSGLERTDDVVVLVLC